MLDEEGSDEVPMQPAARLSRCNVHDRMSCFSSDEKGTGQKQDASVQERQQRPFSSTRTGPVRVTVRTELCTCAYLSRVRLCPTSRISPRSPCEPRSSFVGLVLIFTPFPRCLWDGPNTSWCSSEPGLENLECGLSLDTAAHGRRQHSDNWSGETPAGVACAATGGSTHFCSNAGWWACDWRSQLCCKGQHVESFDRGRVRRLPFAHPLPQTLLACMNSYPSLCSPYRFVLADES